MKQNERSMGETENRKRDEINNGKLNRKVVFRIVTSTGRNK